MTAPARHLFPKGPPTPQRIVPCQHEDCQMERRFSSNRWEWRWNSKSSKPFAGRWHEVAKMPPCEGTQP